MFFLDVIRSSGLIRLKTVVKRESNREYSFRERVRGLLLSRQKILKNLKKINEDRKEDRKKIFEKSYRRQKIIL